VIAANLPLRTVTPYALARRLSIIPQVLTDQFLRVLLPLVSELHATRDNARLRSIYVTSTRLTLAISLPIGCITILLARAILGLWVGAEFSAYADLVMILTLASLIDLSQWPAAFLLQGMNRHRPVAIVSLCTGSVSLGLSVVLVRHFGLRGVALGTLIPTTIEWLGIFLPYALHVIGVRLSEVVFRALVPGVLPVMPMALVVVLMQRIVEPASIGSLVLIMSAGLATDILAYFGVGMSKSERALLRDAFRSMSFMVSGRGRRS
jgi:O-antigen/teichoic acid export membrane protein